MLDNTVFDETITAVYSVSMLNTEAKQLLQQTFPSIWVQGELSNLARPQSGHLYFTLKDNQAQVRCAMFKQRNHSINFEPTDGLEVLVKASVSLYEGRGDYQLIIERMIDAGAGALQREFERLKKRLSAEGLFASNIKQAVPTMPTTLGVITSSTGAAIRDILTTLKRRMPSIPVVIYPTAVQGKTAATEIVQALKTAETHAACDILLLARGGGSLEDLWCFNDEAVVRAIHACQIPIITGIGHEVDFTLADFAADLRAATPTAAAEHATPNINDLLSNMSQQQSRLYQAMHTILQRKQLLLGHAQQRLRHPKQQLFEYVQRFDHAEQTLQRCLRQHLQQQQHRLVVANAKLLSQNPQQQIQLLAAKVNASQTRLANAMQQVQQQNQTRLALAGKALAAINPAATLERGFAIATTIQDNAVIHTSNQVVVNDKINLQLNQGSLVCHVAAIKT